MKKYFYAGAMGLLLALSATSVSAQTESKELVIYSGRGETFVGPVLKMFEDKTGIKLKVRYGSTSEISALLQEEGAKTPADIFWAQDGVALGVNSDLFAPLPKELFNNQPEHFKSTNGSWIGITGRARSLVYSSKRLKKEDLPARISDLTASKWKDRIGWAPGNASFQAFITAMRAHEGEKETQQWVKSMIANGAKSYKNNTAIVQAIADGEIDAGLVNTYYLARFKASDEKFPVEQTFFEDGDIGNLLNVAGVGILKTSKHKEDALKLVEFLLSPSIQQYFSSTGSEYSVIKEVIPNAALGAAAHPEKASPAVDINKLLDIKGTRKLLSDEGLL